MRASSFQSFISLGAPVVFLFACSSSSSTPATPPADTGTASEAGDTGTSETAPDTGDGCQADPGALAKEPVPGGTDPVGGADKFTMAMALEGFPSGTGVLTAKITTENGVITCQLDEKNAPISVANFIGLARGTRYFQSGSSWITKKFYDGLTWHRVIPGFVIQGGDPRGTGTGGPGYSLIDENHVDEPLGTLAMAASTAPSGSQFYIVVGTGPAPNYNVFGKCDTDVAKAIAAVPRDAKDKPLTPVHMNSIVIERCPK